MSLETYDALNDQPSMKPTLTTLSAYNNGRIKPLGIATLTVEHKGHMHMLDFFVVQHQAATILGLPSCRQLDIIRLVDVINATP